MNNREYIRECDRAFKERLCNVADSIGDDGIRLISLSGPTCSGKTTAAVMLAARMERKGRKVHIISIDDFYFNREYLEEMSRKKGNMTVDFDSEETIDTAALDEFIREAFSGETVMCPVFDFKTGCRESFRTLDTGENDVFIFEGIQAIYPRVTEFFKPHGFVSIYISPQSSLCEGGRVFLPNEIRLLRRIVRDSNFRNTNAEFTIKLWESVRQNEEKNIFPYAEACTYHLDSTHDYELRILKPFLERVLGEIPAESPCYEKAREILDGIALVDPLPVSLIEEGSLYKEFV